MILIVDMNFRKDSICFDEFVLPIAYLIREKYEIVHYSELKEKDFSVYDKVILSGTPLKDNNFLDHTGIFEWIKDFEGDILGICAGMQVIGTIFDSSMIRCKETGMTQIKTVKDNPLFSGEFNAYELHNHALEPSGNFEVIAESENCIQAIKHKEKNIFGVLFHPEIRNNEIIERFISL